MSANSGTKHLEQNGAAGAIATNDTGFCTVCGTKSVCTCERCGDFYCSPLCQRKDWPNHRFICLPMPRLVIAGQLPSIQDNKAEVVAETKVLRDENVSSAKRENNTHLHTEMSTMPKNGSCVVITGFKSSNICFVRSANPSITEAYKQVLNQINEFGKASAAITELPKINSYALTKRDNKWCRIQIFVVRAKFIRVFFIDYGIISSRKKNEIHRIEPSITALPCYVHMVKLNGISKISTESNVMATLSNYANKEYRIQFVQPDKFQCNVNLYQWGSDNLLNSLIQTLCSKCIDNGKDSEQISVASSLSNDNDVPQNGMAKARLNGKNNKMEGNHEPSALANKDNIKSKVITNDCNNSNKPNVSNRRIKQKTPPRQIQIQKPCLDPPFKIIPLDEKDRNCSVYIVDNSYIGNGYIGCLLEKYIDNIKEVTMFLKECSINDQPYKPKPNEYCIAQFEDEWYRAKVVEILGDDRFQVVYIDFTNEMELTSQKIRRYPMTLTLPCYTTLCLIEGLPENLEDDLIDVLETKCASFTKLAIDQVQIVEEVTSIKSNELLQQLRDSKFL